MRSLETAIKIEGEVKLTPKQLDIYKGLKEIGEEIASFYLDGVFILNNNFKTKSYLLAHLAREIDGGLRDFLVMNPEINEIFCILCENNLTKRPSHRESILIALDISSDSKLSKKWFEIAKQYHKFAHRSGAWKEPRDQNNMVKLWKEYEDILFDLVGSFLNIHNLFDRIIRYDYPNKEIINTLRNLLKVDARYSYFFQNLDSINWFGDLYKEDYFKKINMHNFIYLEKVALANKVNKNSEISKLLINVINDSIASPTNEDYRADWYTVKILFMLSSEKITFDHIDFIGLSLRKTKFGGLLHSDLGSIVLPVLIEHNMKEHLLRLLPILFECETKEDSFHTKERVPLVEKYWLYEITKKYPKEIANIVGIEGIEVLLEIMRNILASDERAFNVVWVTTIENNKQNSFPDRYDNQITSFVRDMLEEISPDDSHSLLETLVYDSQMIFKRLALHALNYHYEVLKDIFWQWFKSENNVLETVYKHELYQLLSDRAGLSTETELAVVIKWIESLDYGTYYEDRTPEDIEIINAYKRKEWLIPLKDYSPEAQELYDKYALLASEEIDHPGYDYWNSGVRWLDKSPLKDRDAFCSKNVDEILYEIAHFDYEHVDKDPLINNEDWIEGLARDLGSCIQENPQKFVTELEKFEDIDLVYYYYIFDGLQRAWQNKEKFDWQNIFDLIDIVLDATVLASDEKYAIWVKGKISELLRAGTTNDDNAFDKEYLPQAKKILLDLLKHPEEDDVEINDLLSFSLNSSNGKVLHGLIGYALRYGRLHSDRDVKWEPEIKNFFTEQLEYDDSYSLYVFNILGEYLSHIRFLDRQWIEENMDNIFPIEQDTLWQASFMSHMASATMVYQKDYEYFRDNGHFAKALQFDWQDNHVREKILQFIVIAYMSDFDKETVFHIIQEKNLENNLEIIRFIWHLYRDKPDDKRAFIYKLWDTIYNLYKNDENDDMQQIFSTLSKWFVFVEKIDDTNIEWLKRSGQWTEINYNSYFLIEQLLRLVEQNAKYVGNIYLEMLHHNIYPTYKEENIIAIVEKLFKLGEVAQAREICNKYATEGAYFLNEINKHY